MTEIEFQGSFPWRAGNIAAILWLLGSLSLAPASASPKISAPTTQKEIAEMMAGETAEVEYPLANTGTEVLKITQVIVSCGCVTTSYPEELKPGEKSVLKVKLVSNAMWNGQVEKRITIMSNDPDQPAVILELKAQVRPLLRFMPENPVTIQYKKGAVIRQVVTVTSTVSPPVLITGVTPGGPGTEARLLPAESADKPGIARVEITAHPPAEGGDFLTTVVLQTSNPKVATIPVILHAISDDGISVVPRLIYLNNISKPGAQPPIFFALYKRSGTFRVLEIKPDAPELVAEVGEKASPDPKGAYNYCQINLRYRGGWSKGKRSGKIVVTTDDPQAPKIEVSYEANVD